MKPRNEDQKLVEGQTKPKKPRFTIEKLEERIAPHHKVGHYNGGGAEKDCHDPKFYNKGNCRLSR